MNRTNSNCPACRVPMIQGFVADRGHGNNVLPAAWVEGEPEEMKRKLLGFELRWIHLKGHTQLPIESWRCPSCGLLQNFAN